MKRKKNHSTKEESNIPRQPSPLSHLSSSSKVRLQPLGVCPAIGTTATKPIHMSLYIVRPAIRAVPTILAFPLGDGRQVGQGGVLAGPRAMIRSYVTIKVPLLCVHLLASVVRTRKMLGVCLGVLPARGRHYA